VKLSRSESIVRWTVQFSSIYSTAMSNRLLSNYLMSHLAVVVKVTEISQVVTETVNHLDNSRHGNDLAAHVIRPAPEVNYNALSKAGVMRETEGLGVLSV